LKPVRSLRTVLPPDLTVALVARRRREGEAPGGRAYPPGAVVARFTVPGRAVPWKAPFVGARGAFKEASLVAWQGEVRLRARLAMGGRPPHTGPFALGLVFTRKAPRGRRPGDRWAARPDTVNLVKAFEDSLQGVVILDDARQCSLHVERFYGLTDEVLVEVVALAPSGPPPGPPGACP
jgi:Holliday junction resolvase RusA-like endonuclease